MDDDAVPRTLVVTNDFPPRVGGVQQYGWRLVARLPPDRVSVLAPAWPGWQDHDGAQSFPVDRWPTSFLWPTEDLERRVRTLAAEHRADAVPFCHAFPLPWLAPRLAARGIPSIAITPGAGVLHSRPPRAAAAP